MELSSRIDSLLARTGNPEARRGRCCSQPAWREHRAGRHGYRNRRAYEFSPARAAHLRLADLPRLRASGPLGELLARQSEVNASDASFSRLAQSFSGLPNDLLNFHWDPVTCAVAVGWSGATVEELSLRTELNGEVLSFVEVPDGRPTQAVVDIDADAFVETWHSRVEAVQSQGARIRGW